MKIVYLKNITRDILRRNKDVYFLFGDNVKRKGFGGQAKEMRNEPNAIGIATKWFPSMNEKAFFNDNDFDKIKKIIDNDFDKIPKNSNLVIPENGIGTGLAELPIRSPKVYKFILSKINELERNAEFIKHK